MGILWWLAQEFWPIIAGAIALLAGWLGLKAKAASDRKAGREEAESRVVAANAAVRAEQLKVERPGSYAELTAKLRGKR